MSTKPASLETIVAMQKNRSTYRKLLQAAALATVLVPLGSVAVETASVSCRFNNSGEGSYGGSYCNGGDSSADPNRSRFDFFDYWLELEFTMVAGAVFDVEVVTTEMDQAAFEAKADLFPGYTCIALTEGGPCVDFEVRPSEPIVGNWTHYEIEIHWEKWTGQSYDATLMTILHDIGDLGTRDYDEDMCLNPLNDACVIDPDPGIRSGDTDFRSYVASLRPAVTVPEPSTLILLGTGVSGVLLRRRRRTETSEAKA